MLTKFIQRIGGVASKPLRSRNMSSHYTPTVKEPHFNDIPLPAKFQTVNDKRQVGNNFVLVAGLTFCVLSFSYVLNSGVIFFNWTPPKKNPE